MHPKLNAIPNSAGTQTMASGAQSRSCKQRVDIPGQPVQCVTLPEVITASLGCRSLAEAGQTLISHWLSKETSVALLLCYDPHRKQFSIIGDTRGIEPCRALPAGNAIEQVASEAMLLGRDDFDSTEPRRTVNGSPLRQQLMAQLKVEALLVRLLCDEEGSLQGIMILGSQINGSSLRDRCAQECQSLEPLANSLKVLRKVYYNSLQVLRNEAQEAWVSRRATWFVGSLLLSLILLCVPFPGSVSAPCTCEPVNRRLISAPFDGSLLSCLAKPGDTVSKGQTLAVLDGRENRSNIAATHALIEQAEQRYKAALATADPSEVSKEALELKYLQQKLQVLQERNTRLSLTSPIDGVVVSGDMERKQGASVRIGQILLEIAPLNALLAEIEVDESDVLLVEQDASVSVSFRGVHGNSFSGELRSIFPRAELREQSNVFIAEATLQGTEGDLSPGMRGVATIDSRWQCLGWMLLRKPYVHWCRFWGWY